MSLIDQYRQRRSGLAQRPAPPVPNVNATKIAPVTLNNLPDQLPAEQPVFDTGTVEEIGAEQVQQAQQNVQRALSRPSMETPTLVYPTAYSGNAPESGLYDLYRDMMRSTAGQPQATPFDNFEDLMPFAGRTDVLADAFNAQTPGFATGDTPGRIVGDEFNPFKLRWGQMGDGGVGFLAYSVNLLGAVGGEVMGAALDMAGLGQSEDHLVSNPHARRLLSMIPGFSATERFLRDGPGASLLFQAALGRDISFVGAGEHFGLSGDTPQDDYYNLFGNTTLDEQATDLFQRVARLQYGLTPEQYQADIDLWKQNREAFRVARTTAANDIALGNFPQRGVLGVLAAPLRTIAVGDRRVSERIDRLAHERLVNQGVNISFEDYQRVTALTTREVTLRFAGDFVMPDPADLGKLLTRGGLALTRGTPLNTLLRTDLGTGRVMDYVDGEFIYRGSGLANDTSVLPTTPTTRELPGTNPVTTRRLPPGPDPIELPEFSPIRPMDPIDVEVVVLPDAPVAVNRLPVEPPELPTRIVDTEASSSPIQSPKPSATSIDTPRGDIDLPGASRQVQAEDPVHSVNPQQVIADWEANGLTNVVPEIVDQYKAKILAGEDIGLPRVSYFSEGNAFNVTPGFDIPDGRHRMLAYKELGYTSVPVRLDSDVPFDELPSFSKADEPDVKATPIVAPETPTLKTGQTVYVPGGVGKVVSIDDRSALVRLSSPDYDSFKDWVSSVYKPAIANPPASLNQLSQVDTDVLRQMAADRGIANSEGLSRTQLNAELHGKVKHAELPADIQSTRKRFSLKDILPDYEDRIEQVKRLVPEGTGSDPVRLLNAVRDLDEGRLNVREVELSDITTADTAPIVTTEVTLSDGSKLRTETQANNASLIRETLEVFRKIVVKKAEDSALTPTKFIDSLGPVEASKFISEVTGLDIRLHSNLGSDELGYLVNTWFGGIDRQADKIDGIDAYILAHGTGHAPAGTWGPDNVIAYKKGDATVTMLPESWQSYVNRHYEPGTVVNVSACQTCRLQQARNFDTKQNIVAGNPDKGPLKQHPNSVSFGQMPFRIADVGDRWAVGKWNKGTLSLDTERLVDGTLNDAIKAMHELHPATKAFDLGDLPETLGSARPFSQTDRAVPYDVLPEPSGIPESAVVSSDLGPPIKPGQYAPGQLADLLRRRVMGENVTINGIPFHTTQVSEITNLTFARRARFNLMSLIPGSDGVPVVAPSPRFAMEFQERYGIPHPFASFTQDTPVQQLMRGTSDPNYSVLKAWARESGYVPTDDMVAQFASSAHNSTGEFINVGEQRSVFVSMKADRKNMGSPDITLSAETLAIGDVSEVNSLAVDIGREYASYNKLLDTPGALSDPDVQKYVGEATAYFNEARRAIQQQTNEVADTLSGLYKRSTRKPSPEVGQTEAQFQRFIETNNTGRFC